MKTFRIVASKNNNKVTLVNQYESIEEARYDVGRQGYAIIEIGELKEGMTLEGIFYFEIQTSDGIRKGKIKSDDIFRAYVKLVDDLGYKVLFIYDRADATDEYKKLMTVNIEKSYGIYREQSGKKKQEEKAAAKSQDASGNFAAQKEIERLHAVYAKMLAKAESILNTYREDLSSDLRNDLGNIVSRIKTIGAISNIDRLRSFGEESLQTIGKAELAIINKRSITEKRDFLEETNKLLKGVGSHRSIVHADDSIAGNLKKLFAPVLEKFKDKAAPAKIAGAAGSGPTAVVVTKAGSAAVFRPANTVVKKGSYLYYHVLKDIETYQKKRKAIFQEWLHALFRLDAEGIRHKRIKLNLVSQNVRLLKARLAGHSFSYTKIVQGFRFYMDALFGLTQGLADLCVTVFAVLAAYFAVEFSFGAFFREDLFMRPSFIYLLTVIAAAAVAVKACTRIWHLAPATLSFLAFLVVLHINF